MDYFALEGFSADPRGHLDYVDQTISPHEIGSERQCGGAKHDSLL